MSLLYKRIIEEIGDSHSELVERFVRELSGETRMPLDSDGSVFQLFQDIYSGGSKFSSLTSSQKEELERLIIEAIDNDVPDNQIYELVMPPSGGSSGQGQQ